jgi:hypothetical protein
VFAIRCDTNEQAGLAPAAVREMVLNGDPGNQRAKAWKDTKARFKAG